MVAVVAVDEVTELTDVVLDVTVLIDVVADEIVEVDDVLVLMEVVALVIVVDVAVVEPVGPEHDMARNLMPLFTSVELRVT